MSSIRQNSYWFPKLSYHYNELDLNGKRGHLQNETFLYFFTLSDRYFSKGKDICKTKFLLLRYIFKKKYERF